MKVVKRFRWEGAHRLLMHNGDCRNLHGHSYIMTIELIGKPVSDMLIDFGEIKKITTPLVQALDHATLVFESDKELLEVLKRINSKMFLLPYESTSENLCRFILDYFVKRGSILISQNNIESIVVRLQETETCYAELEYFAQTQIN